MDDKKDGLVAKEELRKSLKGLTGEISEEKIDQMIAMAKWDD